MGSTPLPTPVLIMGPSPFREAQHTSSPALTAGPHAGNAELPPSSIQIPYQDSNS